MAVRALMVDVDGVVVVRRERRRWDHSLEADLGLAADALQREFFRVHFQEVTLGRADLHERLALVLPQIAPHLTSAQLVAYWFAQDAHLDETLLADLSEIRSRGVQVHLATIQEHYRARYLWNDLGLSEWFDAMHYAADLGCCKPEPEFFRAIETRTGFAPEELLLIDDSVANVEGARACGWGAVPWDGTERLPAVLRRAGVEFA